MTETVTETVTKTVTETATGKRALVRALFSRVLRRQASRGLDGVFVDGLDAAREASLQGPVIFAGNHVAHWDVSLVSILDDELGTDGYALMDARSISRLPFFRAVGCVPVHVGDPARTDRDLHFAASLLSRPRRALWIFPQGRHTPSHLRPLHFHRGLARLAALSSAQIVPFALTYAFFDAPQPRALVRLMPALPSTASLDDVAASVTAGLDATDDSLRAQRTDGACVCTGQGPDPARGFATRLLAAMTRAASS